MMEDKKTGMPDQHQHHGDKMCGPTTWCCGTSIRAPLSRAVFWGVLIFVIFCGGYKIGEIDGRFTGGWGGRCEAPRAMMYGKPMMKGMVGDPEQGMNQGTYPAQDRMYPTPTRSTR